MLWKALAPKDFPNGAVMFSSAGLLEVMHPSWPLRGRAFFCGERFDISAVQEALRIRRECTYGVVVIDGDEATLGSICVGQKVSKLMHVSTNIASRTRRGGQSANRYSRNRDAEELAFLRNVVEMTSTAFSDVQGLIVGGRGDLKRKLLAEFPHPLRSLVARVVDLRCSAGVEGLQQAAAHLGETVEMKSQNEADASVNRFLELVAQTNMHADSLVCYGETQTLAALRLGAVDELLVASVPIGLASRSSEDWCRLAATFGSSAVVVDPRTDVTLHFCQGFGVGARLRYSVQSSMLEETPASDLDVSDELHKSPSTPPMNSDSESASTAISRTQNVVVNWLQEALNVAVADPVTAESLALCAELVLFDESTSPEERLQNTLDMLYGEGVPEDVLLELTCHFHDYLGSEAM